MGLIQISPSGGNDTAAMQAALSSGNAIHILPGSGGFNINAPLTVNPATIFYGVGAGGSIINHLFDGRLFNFTGNAGMDFHSFSVVSAANKSKNSHVFFAPTGAVKSKFSSITLAGARPAGLFDCTPNSTIDTVDFIDNQLEGIIGTGYGIGQGSQVLFRGGRIIGQNQVEGIGVQLYGNNGGVHFDDGIDIIQIGCGLYITKDNGVSNREIFINQASIDSCGLGLYALDSSYINWIGVWAASCNLANINLAPSYNGLATLTGGTIFNAGANGGSGDRDGIVINGPCTVILNDIVIRNNKGTAVRCPNGNYPSGLTLQGCKMLYNNVAFYAGGSVRLIDNEFVGNSTTVLENGIKYVACKGNIGFPSTPLNPNPP